MGLFCFVSIQIIDNSNNANISIKYPFMQTVLSKKVHSLSEFQVLAK